MSLFNPIIGMIHNTKNDTYHPVVFSEHPLPGPPEDGKLVRHKSKMHHTNGFATREEALANARGELAERVAEHFSGKPRFCLAKDFPWDGEGVPAMVVFFVEVNGEMQPA